MDILKTLTPDQLAILVVALFYVTKELVQFTSKVILKTQSKTEENTQAVRELTLQLKHLESKLVTVEKTLDEYKSTQHMVWKLEKDIAFAFEKIRDLRST